MWRGTETLGRTQGLPRATIRLPDGDWFGVVRLPYLPVDAMPYETEVARPSPRRRPGTPKIFFIGGTAPQFIVIVSTTSVKFVEPLR